MGTGDAANGVSVAMGGCFNAELKAQDAQLNAAYRVAMNKRTPNRRSALRTEQRAWIKQRDAQCNEGAVGGTIDLVDVPSCILEETIRRRIALQSMVN
ncbi:lysozyme inhibitor LprI family protein [Sphingomonas sp. ERG5]|uniref:lysozyme inhibitor LprI family protein n=1 Tax=Sphingomonas sp. ERG5 TaxID=1381597 RepID=UPI00054B98F2|nr:lysozyme inhibitor LprI family protein [Sphingomonas sp. ERG5]